MNLKTIFQNSQDYNSYFCDLIKANAIFWQYSPAWIEYQKAYSQKHASKDLSFLLIKDHNPVAFCPLFLEAHQGHQFFSYGLNFQTAPFISKKVSQKLNKKIEKACFDEIDRLAKKYGALKSMLQLNPVDTAYSFNLF